MKNENNFHKIIKIFKALCEPNRLRIFLALQGRNLCLFQIIPIIKLAPSTISKHLSLLLEAGLIERRKEGKMVNYKGISLRKADPIHRSLKNLIKVIIKDKIVKKDIESIEKILKKSKEELCQIYHRK